MIIGSAKGGVTLPNENNSTVGLGSAAGAWTPLSISDCYAWYDASDSSTITKDESDLVEKWENKEGTTERDLLQSTAGRKPLWIEDGSIRSDYDVLDFGHTTDASVMFTASALAAVAMPVTVACACFMPPNNSQQNFLWSEFSAAPSFEKSNVASRCALVWTGYMLWNSMGSEFISNWADITCIADNGSSSIRGNDIEQANVEIVAFSGTWTPLCIGAHGGQPTVNTTMWRQEIGEIVIYNKHLSSDELTLLSDYLQDKWV